MMRECLRQMTSSVFDTGVLGTQGHDGVCSGDEPDRDVPSGHAGNEFVGQASVGGGAGEDAGKTDAVRYLIAHGADIHRRDDNRRTALHWAKRENHPYIVTILEQAGATE